MNRTTPILAAALAISTFIPAAPVHAWNSPGHMIVALIAREQMNANTIAKADKLLRAHPRFAAHFERTMPRYLSRSDDQRKARWYFAHAGTWPDQVRNTSATVDREDVNRFNRPFWHYINMPIFLDDGERRRLEPGLKLYISRQPPDDPDETGMNVIQAVKNSSRIVRDANAPADRRAVHLCWLIHLAGDSHQPLHAGALYTANRFPRGDEGGSQFEIEHDWNLHGFWDAQICTQEDFGTLQTLTANLLKNGEHAAVGKQAAMSTDIEKWIDESHALGKRVAYTTEVLQKVAERENHLHLSPLALSPAYKTEAESVAERRAIEAGYRLAKLLDELFK